MQMARTKQFWKTMWSQSIPTCRNAYVRTVMPACSTRRTGSWMRMKRKDCRVRAATTQANINKKKQCAKKMRRLIKTSLKRKTADFFLCLHNPNLATYLMPVEGRESSAKVWETIFQPHASRNHGEREREPAIGKHEYSALNLHVLSSSSSGPLVPCSVDCRYNQLCK